MSERIAITVILLMGTALSSAWAGPQAEYRDPTRPMDWRAPSVAPDTTAREPEAALKLQGTFSVDGSRSAIISGRRVAVGDVVSGAEVLEIRKNMVVLRLDGETVELASTMPSVKAPVDNQRGLR